MTKSCSYCPSKATTLTPEPMCTACAIAFWEGALLFNRISIKTAQIKAERFERNMAELSLNVAEVEVI